MIDGTRSSDRTTELVLAYYAAYNRADLEGMLAMVGDGIVHEINQGRREVGREALRGYLVERARCYREQLSDVVVLASWDGNRAAAEYQVEGSYLATQGDLPAAHGQTYRLAGGAFFEVQGSRITRITNYYNLQDWLRQVGTP